MLLVEIGPGRLQAGVWRGGVLSPVHTVTFDDSIWEGAWKEGLRPLDAPLREALAGLSADATTHPTVGFYHSPTAVADVFTCPGGGRASAEAALLALGETAGFSLDENPHDHCVLKTEPARVGVGGAALGKQTHRLIAADTDAGAAAVTSWLERAGLRVRAIAPVTAAHIKTLIDRVAGSEHPGATIMLRVGEHRSQLAASIGGRLRLVRHVSLDLQTLTQALTLPMTVRSAAGTSEARLSRDEARAMLFRVGIPERDMVIDEARGLTGAAALPLLQPVLQRAIVEMRQSLRFGLEEPERDGARLVVIGPGSAVPNLGEMLAALLSLKAASPSCPDEHRTDLEDAGAHASALGINLLPYGSVLTQGVRRVRMALMAGAACAAVYAGMDGAMTWYQTRELSDKIEALREPTRQAREFLEDKEKTASRDNQMSRLRRAIDGAIGEAAPWSAWMEDLAALTPDSVKLRDITMTSDSGTARCEVRGEIRPDGAGRAEIGPFVGALERSALVSNVSLGGTQRSGNGDGAVEFQTSVTLWRLPVFRAAEEKASNQPVPAQAAAVTKEQTP